MRCVDIMGHSEDEEFGARNINIAISNDNGLLSMLSGEVGEATLRPNDHRSFTPMPDKTALVVSAHSADFVWRSSAFPMANAVKARSCGGREE
jgi:hypothetical protein